MKKLKNVITSFIMIIIMCIPKVNAATYIISDEESEIGKYVLNFFENVVSENIIAIIAALFIIVVSVSCIISLITQKHKIIKYEIIGFIELIIIEFLWEYIAYNLSIYFNKILIWQALLISIATVALFTISFIVIKKLVKNKMNKK